MLYASEFVPDCISRGLNDPEFPASGRSRPARARQAVRCRHSWGVAAALWLLTGLARAFGHFEKAPDFYLRNGFFWVKMTLFLVVVALEIWPMLTFIRWRIARRAGRPLPQFDRLPRLVLVDDLQTALVVVIPFVAAAMARGLWLY